MLIIVKDPKNFSFSLLLNRKNEAIQKTLEFHKFNLHSFGYL